ncbi:MAG: DNA (cytosine-5)-methyltransferase 1 [Oceanicoccus sp.]
MDKKQPTAIDLFAGAGGFSLAARDTGFKLLAAVEIDKDACETYKHNFIKNKKNKPRLYQQDILNELTPEQLRTDLSLFTGELDLLMGGPPCQGFSSHRINSAGVDDPRNQLLLRYFEYVKELRPKVFLVENVTGMLWKRHEDYVAKFKALAKRHGYKLYGPQIINSKDYGVPQNRRRVFILGVDKKQHKGSIDWPPAKTHGPETNQPFLTASTVFEKPPKKKLGELINILAEETLAQLDNHSKEDLQKAKLEAKKIVSSLTFLDKPIKTDTCNQRMNTSDILAKRISYIKMNGNRDQIPEHLVINCHKGGYGGHKDVYGRIKLAQPSNTITTGCNNLSKGRFTHPWLNTGISIREAASLQTFPRDFVFLSNQTSQAKQVGNAVPIELGKALIKYIKKTIL